MCECSTGLADHLGIIGAAFLQGPAQCKSPFRQVSNPGVTDSATSAFAGLQYVYTPYDDIPLGLTLALLGNPEFFLLARFLWLDGGGEYSVR
jgi:hypothetical protein